MSNATIAGWSKATASNGNGQCVELAPTDGGVAIRDSKDPDGPVLMFTHAEIAAFLNGAKRGEFDELVAPAAEAAVAN